MPLQGVPSLFGGRRGATAGSSSLLTTLVAAWNLNDVSDSAGTNTLTNVNTVTFQAGLVNLAALINNTGQMLSHASNATLQLGDIDWTIGLWVNLNTTAGLQVFLAKDDATRDYLIDYTGSGAQRFQVQAYTAGNTPITAVANTFGLPSISTWYCIIAWYDSVNDILSISVNNGTADTTSGGPLQAAGTADFTLGDRQAQDFRMNGLLDIACIWKRVLTAPERACFYNAGAGSEYPFTGLCT